VPEDNPFVDGDGTNFDEIWAYGIRHAWRFNFDPANGNLWTADTGENNWEEVDRIVRGGNYGWNVMEGSHCYPPFVQQCTEPEGHIPPHAEYAQQPDNAAAIGGFVYHGDAIPGLQGWYVFGDFLKPRIFAVHPDFPGHDPVVLYEGTGCACLTSFAETPDGELLAILAPRGDDPGLIVQIVPRSPLPK
jgi:glucose/arabinose dehydrogenase